MLKKHQPGTATQSDKEIMKVAVVHLCQIVIAFILRIFSECELTFTFVNSRSRSLYAIARPSVCLSVTFVRPTQAVQIFGNISTALGTLATR